MTIIFPCNSIIEPNIGSRSLEAAGVGGWEMDVASGSLTWTPVTFLIHGLDPGVAPPLETCLDFYPPESRPVIESAVLAALEFGTPWDLDLPFVTARGQRIWVRSHGRTTIENGKVTRLYGAFRDITALRKLSDNAERLALVARQMKNAVIISDRTGRTEWVNDAFCRLTGYSLEDLRGRKPGSILQGPETNPETRRYMAQALARGDGFDIEIINYTRHREAYWIAIACTPLHDEAGRVNGFIAIESDVSARRAAEAEAHKEALERQRAEALLRDVLDALPSAVTAFDADDRLILANSAYNEMMPIAARFAQDGRPLSEIIALAAKHGQFPDAGTTEGDHERWISENVKAHLVAGPARTERLADGRFVLARERRSANSNLVCIRTDTTDLKHAEAELRLLAEQDSLTGLANRASLLAALSRCLSASVGEKPSGGTLLMFDIDHFKQINDSLGHDVGDLVLVEVAQRLRATCRHGDVAARLGGDEFAVFMPGLIAGSAARARIAQIHAALSLPIAHAKRPMALGISAGATWFPADGFTAQRLLKNADLALYEAKRTGRARWCAFRPEQADARERHVKLADALRAALAAGDVTVALQPKTHVSGEHAGFEALARWHDGTRWVPPAEFIPVAEEEGLILPLGTAILDLALGRIRSLRDMNLDTGHVAVNVTGLQLLDQSFIADLQAALEHHGLAPEDLELEVTETVFFGRAAEQIEISLRSLHDLGVSLALDDFGTGFASLTHLINLPIDRIKIDRSFINDIGKGGRGEVILRSMIGLARSLDMEAIAEGVETREQFDFLAAEGCDVVQGYLFSKPLSSQDEAATYLRSRTASPFPWAV